jgi:hypothetical protein
MNVTMIKQAVEGYTMEQLLQAEQAMLNETDPVIEIGGADEGEKLTHVLAAIFCKHEMQHGNISINQAIRMYSQRVRGSID